MPITTNYIWDEEDLLAEADGTSTIQTLYTNEPEQYGNLISSRLPVAGTPTTVYHHFDALGSTRQLTNGAGSVTDTVIYDAWGNVVSRTGASQTRLLWRGVIGYYSDQELAQFYVRRRFYDPLAFRWNSVDPYEFDDGLNRYLYALANPIRYCDPSGTKAGPGKYSCCCSIRMPTTGCETWKIAGFYSYVFPHALGRGIRAQFIAHARDVFSQCCVLLSNKGTAFITEAEAAGILGKNSVLDDSDTPVVQGDILVEYKPTSEVVALTKDQSNSVINLYWVPFLRSGALGVSFITEYYPLPPAPAAVIANKADERTPAHEIGHILLNMYYHDVDKDNLMHATNEKATGADLLKEWQCNKIRKNSLLSDA